VWGWTLETTLCHEPGRTGPGCFGWRAAGWMWMRGVSVPLMRRAGACLGEERQTEERRDPGHLQEGSRVLGSGHRFRCSSLTQQEDAAQHSHGFSGCSRNQTLRQLLRQAQATANGEPRVGNVFDGFTLSPYRDNCYFQALPTLSPSRVLGSEAPDPTTHTVLCTPLHALKPCPLTPL